MSEDSDPFVAATLPDGGYHALTMPYLNSTTHFAPRKHFY